jgi:hypothetical protein
MPQYLVTMSLAKAEPLIDIGHLTNIVTQKILPSLDALTALAQVVVSPSSAEPCLYKGPVAAGIFDFVNLTPCDVHVVSD